MTATEWRTDADRDIDDDTGGHGLPPRGRRRRHVALGVVIAVVLGVFATWLVAFSPVFGVSTVDVRGTRTLAKPTVEQAADIEYGQPVVRVDTAAITQRVEALPQVESAEVSTSFPDTIVITVVERTPVGYVTVAGRHLLVDRDGVQYLGVDTVPARLPRLALPSTSTGADARTADAVAHVAAAMPADLLRRVRSIGALDAETITVVLRGGMVVRWGSADASTQKAKVIAALLRHRPAPGQVDVTDPDRPFTRP